MPTPYMHMRGNGRRKCTPWSCMPEEYTAPHPPLATQWRHLESGKESPNTRQQRTNRPSQTRREETWRCNPCALDTWQTSCLGCDGPWHLRRFTYPVHLIIRFCSQLPIKLRWTKQSSTSNWLVHITSSQSPLRQAEPGVPNQPNSSRNSDDESPQ